MNCPVVASHPSFWFAVSQSVSPAPVNVFDTTSAEVLAVPTIVTLPASVEVPAPPIVSSPAILVVPVPLMMRLPPKVLVAVLVAIMLPVINLPLAVVEARDVDVVLVSVPIVVLPRSASDATRLVKNEVVARMTAAKKLVVVAEVSDALVANRFVAVALVIVARSAVCPSTTDVDA